MQKEEFETIKKHIAVVSLAVCSPLTEELNIPGIFSSAPNWRRMNSKRNLVEISQLGTVFYMRKLTNQDERAILEGCIGLADIGEAK